MLSFPKCFKVPIVLGAAVLVGCATPLPNTPVSQPASPAPSPSAIHVPPAASPAQAQPTAPTTGETNAASVDPTGEQTQMPPAADAPWKQQGLASWYGKRFHGRRTASGERFKAGDFTAAHRALPFGSYVRVRRVAGGEDVVVRINDRGPFHPGRVLDLSYAAAKKLGILGSGNAEVEMELATEEEWRLMGNSAKPGNLRK